jgi:hypothetical protein
MAWTATSLHPPADCSVDWSVPFRLPAADLADDELDWSTAPSSPWLLTRTGSFVLQASFWME